MLIFCTGKFAAVCDATLCGAILCDARLFDTTLCDARGGGAPIGGRTGETDLRELAGEDLKGEDVNAGANFSERFTCKCLAVVNWMPFLEMSWRSTIVAYADLGRSKWRITAVRLFLVIISASIVTIIMVIRGAKGLRLGCTATFFCRLEHIKWRW